MKIVSYNVNGLRAALGKGLVDWLKEVDADVICLQETKLQPEQFDASLVEALGYHCYLFSAEKKGYSGVAIFCKKEPLHVAYGMGIEQYDREGRMIRVDYPELSIASIYHPSGSSGDERQAFKMQWLEDWEQYISKLRLEHPKLVLAGDYNICHEAIDIHDPVRNATSSGFLPEEREWMSHFLSEGYIDSFRALHPEEVKYSWWSYRSFARKNNKGWRIDYCMLTDTLSQQLKEAEIYNDAIHSDHCSISVTLDV